MSNKTVPAELNEVRGNPGKRGKNKDQPKPTVGISTCPSWLMPEAKREWSRLTKELDKLNMLTEVDRVALATFCQLWGRFVEGEKADSPLNVAAITQMRLYAVEFGLTPSARSRMVVEQPKDVDPFAELMENSNTQN